MNYQLQTQDQSVTPGMTIILTSVDGPTEVVLISGLGECALSEDKVHVFDKMESEIRAHPEANFAVIALIREAITYQSPSENSLPPPPFATVMKNLSPPLSNPSLINDLRHDRSTTP